MKRKRNEEKVRANKPNDAARPAGLRRLVALFKVISFGARGTTVGGGGGGGGGQRSVWTQKREMEKIG